MKKIMSLLFISMLLLSSVFATQISPSFNPPNNFPFENNQYYAVLFDEEGEATVIAKINLQNMQKQEMKNLLLEIPGNAQILYVIQETNWHYESFESSLPSIQGKPVFMKEKIYGPKKHKTALFTQENINDQ